MLNFESMVLLASIIMLFVALNSNAKIYGKVLTLYSVAYVLALKFGLRFYYLV